MYNYNNHKKSQKKGNIKKIKESIILILVIVGLILASRYYNSINKKDIDSLVVKNDVIETKQDENDIIKVDNENDDKVIEDKIETVEIAAVGDILMHMGIVNSQYDNNTGKYDFNDNFEYIKEYLDRADLAIANLETTLAGEDEGYSGYPSFNSPDEIADAIKKSGIDMVSNMSNHSIDKGKSGFLRTRKVLDEKGLECIGSRDTETDKRYIIKDIKGIKVGVIAYGYTTSVEGGGRGLNGIPIPDDIYPLMNAFDPDDIENSFAEMKNEINKMKNDGADILVFYMHWGEEYQLEPNSSQRQIAELLAREGVDVILGDHPHTVQPMDILLSDDGKHKTVVAYSLGNIISNQRKETVGNSYTEDGVIANVKITKNFTTGEVEVENATYIPTWVKIGVYDGKRAYRIIPFEEENKDYLSLDELERANSSFNRTIGIIESYTDAVEVWNDN